jgi:putative flavoprotein involved in K+ transport
MSEQTRRDGATMLEEGTVWSDRNVTCGSSAPAERVPVVIIGAGQSGLSTGYHLARRGIPFVILDERERVGDVWRERWDSLRLFTPARFDGLDGMPFPASPDVFPTKDAMADYLESYARAFHLPVRHGVRVDRLTRDGDRYLVSAGSRRFEAEHVVVAMATYQKPRVPAFATGLDPRILQRHSSEYQRPSQMPPGDVLVVGAGTSGAEVALDLVRRDRHVWLSGRSPGEVPFRIDSPVGRRVLAPIVFRALFHRLLTVDTPIGRRARPQIISRGGPLIRARLRDLVAAGVETVPRVEAVRDGKPVLAGGRVLDVSGIVWCTGFHHGLTWVDLPVFEDDGEPRQYRGVVPGEPGLYFVGQHFLYAMSSTMIHGAGRDASRVAEAIGRRFTRAAA